MQKIAVGFLAAGLASVGLMVCTQSKSTTPTAAPSKGRIAAPESFKNGAWLCYTPASANSFDQSAFDAHRRKIELTYSILDQIAVNDDCKRVNSNGLKPLEVYGVTVKVSDRENAGWVGRWSYLSYMNFHVVRLGDASENHSQDGAWLCPEAANAGKLGDDLHSMRLLGIQITDSVLQQLAENNKCVQVNSDELSPIYFGVGWAKAKPSDYLLTEWDAIKVSDGRSTGWMPEYLFFAYMRRHVVRAR